jgi:hypothetical protein
MAGINIDLRCGRETVNFARKDGCERSEDTVAPIELHNKDNALVIIVLHVVMN